MAADYFPLEKGLRLSYRHKDAAGAAGEMRFEVASILEKGGVVTADCRRTFVAADDTRTRTPRYLMIKDPGVGWLTSSLWGKEFPLPPKPGDEWLKAADRFQVTELQAGIQVPAGFFTDCLRVVRFAAGGDAGTEERFYAPSVGLVYALSTDENDPYELALLKKP